VAACQNHLTSPGQKTVSIVIAGPNSIPPGQAASLVATEVSSDGRGRVLTSDVIWESSDSRFVSVSASGLITAGADPGEAEITARYTGSLPPGQTAIASGKKTVAVLPAGTFIVSGSVRNDGGPLSDVDIEVTAGVAAGTHVTANPSFRLYGVAGDTEIRAGKVGFETQVRRILVNGNQTVNFDLIWSDSLPMVAGTYTLSIVAGADCRANLPANARARTYTAVISQTGALLQVVLSGPGMSNPWSPSDTFAGSVQSTKAQFTPARYTGEGTVAFSPPSILDLLEAPGKYFTFFGSVAATPTQDGYSGTLDGSLDVLALSGPWDIDPSVVLASCPSKTHQFVLTR